MSDVYSDIYWTREFEVTVADLDRIASYIEETGQARDLTALARRVVRGRLRHGPETSPAAQPTWAKDPSVRVWDPGGIWHDGDRVIVARHLPGRIYRAVVGRIVRVDSKGMEVELDQGARLVTFLRAPPGSEKARNWHALVESAIENTLRSPQLELQIEGIILRHGERIVSQLFDSLQGDPRFVELHARWFLLDLAAFPTDHQLIALAWAMLQGEDPQPTEAVIPLAQPPLAEGDPSLFGLYLALRARPDLFINVSPGQRPSWTVAGPPPGGFIPRYAAYDPNTYEILCLPGQRTDENIVQRLWKLDLLRVVI